MAESRKRYDEERAAFIAAQKKCFDTDMKERSWITSDSVWISIRRDCLNLKPSQRIDIEAATKAVQAPLAVWCKENEYPLPVRVEHSNWNSAYDKFHCHLVFPTEKQHQ